MTINAFLISGIIYAVAILSGAYFIVACGNPLTMPLLVVTVLFTNMIGYINIRVNEHMVLDTTYRFSLLLIASFIVNPLFNNLLFNLAISLTGCFYSFLNMAISFSLWIIPKKKYDMSSCGKLKDCFLGHKIKCPKEANFFVVEEHSVFDSKARCDFIKDTSIIKSETIAALYF